MKKKYLDVNVYDSLMIRFKFIFEEFENIYVSFSGGKDSGLLLNLLLDYLKKEGIKYNRIFSERPTLNDVFLELTGKELRD